MSLVTASLISLAMIKLFNPKKDRSNEYCPVPFYGDEQLADAFAEAFAKKQN